MNNIKYIRIAFATIIILCIGICVGKWLNTSNKKDKMYIKQEISSTHKIIPDTFSINLTITANQRLKNTSQLTKDQEDSILIASNKINTLVQEAKEICIGADFDIICE